MKIEGLFSVTGKTALVTGGASGIGSMMTEALCANGARVIIASRKIDACKEAAATINAKYSCGECIPFQADLAKEADLDSLASFVTATFGNLNILINNAGKTWGAPFDDFPTNAWESVMSVNVTAPFSLTQKLVAALAQSATPDNPARVINIGSVVGERPVSNNAYSYGASKAAIHHLTKILANDLANRSITVNALAPGAFPSRMMAHATEDKNAREELIASTPLSRLGMPQDIAGATLFLCSQASAFITGTVLPVDGGIAVSV